MNAPMPARLLTPEGEAWLLRARLLYEAFQERGNGDYFARVRLIEDGYAKLPPVNFLAEFAA